MTSAGLMLGGFVTEAVFGWPDRIHRRIAHPVVWIGILIEKLDQLLNQLSWPHRFRYILGASTSILIIIVVTGTAFFVSSVLPNTVVGYVIEMLLASSLIASRSLYTHVAAVVPPLEAGNLSAARMAVSHIVGRDPNILNEAGIARASLESLAENASDGVIAPIFWGVLFGLPGLAAYKAINTLDSMIGHRTDRYLAFGGFAARLDDLVNWVPARMTAVLFAAGTPSVSALRVMIRDAPFHRSPNAGWPESALAGALGVRLSGPRKYEDRLTADPWLNGSAPDPGPAEIRRGLAVYVRALVLTGGLLIALAVSL